MVSFEIFVKALPPSLSELKVIPSFCFAFKIPDDVTASIKYDGEKSSGKKYFEIPRAPSELLLPSAEKSAKKGQIGLAG
jgi:hypothetical protein